MSRSPLPFRIIPCSEWGATEPSGSITRVGKPSRTIFHHTAGHVPNLSAGETYLEACAYARAIQRFHMGQGWTDSGHNFLITRGGFILEGRHGSVASLLRGVMVRSAHCPTQNDQPGVEHEHKGTEGMTMIEKQASIWLHGKLATWSGITPANLAHPHRRYFATSCPGNLEAWIPTLRKAVAADLKAPDDDDEAWWLKYSTNPPPWFFRALQEYARRLGK